MGFAFNPFTGNFDQKGSGGGASYIDGEEATYNDLSLDAGVAPLNSAWLVRNSSGIWPFNKPGGIYIRTATGGASRDADYTYAGTMPDVFSDAVLTIYDEASTTRTGQFNLGSVTAGQNRVLTWPDANGTIARTQDFASPPAIGNTTAAAANFTTVGATGAITGAVAGTTSATSGCNGFQIPVPAAGGSSAVGMYGAFTAGSQRAVIFGAGTSGSTATLADFSASGLVANSIQNTPIGSTTRNSGAFTTISASSTITAENFYRFRELGAGLFLVSVGGGTIALGASPDHWALFSSSRCALIGDLSFGRNAALGQSYDTILTRDAANTLAQVNGTNAQTFRLYGTFTTSTNYQRMTVRSVKQTLSALSGASATTTGTLIPDGAVVVGVTTRVATAITGATGYQVGDGTDADRWGDITGTAIGTTSDNRDWTAGTIECFTAGGNITLTAKTSNFTAGAIEICVFYLAGEAD